MSLGAFRLFGFDVRIHPSFLLMGVLLGLPRGNDSAAILSALAWLLVVTLSVLVHELGHAFAARRFGRSARIELYSLGGLTSYDAGDGEGALTHRQRALISLAGPAAGFALGGAVLLVRALGVTDGELAAVVLGQLVWVNLGWGALNLLPMLPLDGGHVLQSTVDALTRNKGAMITHVISLATAGLACGIALSFGLTWAALIAGFCAVKTFGDIRTERAERQDEALRPRLDEARAAARRGEHVASIAALQAIVAEARSEALRGDASLSLAWLHFQGGDTQAATDALGAAPDGRRRAPLIIGPILDAQGRHDDAIAVLQPVVDESLAGTERWWLASEALLRAQANAGHPEAALAWLSEHAQAGSPGQAHGVATAVLFRTGHYAEAAEIGAESFAAHGRADDAYNVACCYARIPDRAQEALGWLEKALAAGYADASHLDADADLEAVRQLPEYAALRARLAPGDRV